MQSVLIVVHLMIVIMLVVTVLLQRSEGGALGLGGGSGFLTGRGQANALTRATAILAGLFFVTSLSLTILARFGQGGPEVLFQSVTPVEQSGKAAPSKGSLLDQLKGTEGEPIQPPALPPGVSLPAENSMPVETDENVPEETNSIVQVKRPAPGGLDLPAPKGPATPLANLPATPAPGREGEAGSAPKSLPLKAEPPALSLAK